MKLGVTSYGGKSTELSYLTVCSVGDVNIWTVCNSQMLCNCQSVVEEFVHGKWPNTFH